MKPGDQIGIMGDTGDSSGPHLHFAIFTRKGEINDSFSPWGYGLKQINEYAWKYSSGSNAIYYDPLEVFRTNGAIILSTLNYLKEKENENAKK